MVHALKQLNWRVFALLLIAGLLGVVAVLPFMSDLVSTIAPDSSQWAPCPGRRLMTGR